MIGTQQMTKAFTYSKKNPKKKNFPKASVSTMQPNNSKQGSFLCKSLIKQKILNTLPNDKI